MNLNLKHNRKYLIACSGGPDSMLLIHLMHKNNYDIIVCHVNYQKRETANRDQKIVTDFCNKHNLKLEILNATATIYKNFDKFKNFQNQAREMRYDFFNKIAIKYHVDNVCIGHQRDDFLETAIWQSQIKKTQTTYYGIKSEIKLFNLHIFRPLLAYYKSAILIYLKEHNINYGIDETNIKNIYTRNVIRQKLNQYDNKQKEILIKDFQNKNLENQKVEKVINDIFTKWQKTNFRIDFINNLLILDRQKLIYKYLHNHHLNVKVSNDKLIAITKFLLKKDHRKTYRIGNGISLTKKTNLLAFIFKK